MSEHRRAVTRLRGAPATHRRRLLIGAVGALGVSGLILGGVSFPVSAGEMNAGGNLHASIDVQSDCVTAVAGTGEADGSIDQQESSDATGLKATAQGTATVSVCSDDLGGPPPDDPGGSLPGDLDDMVPGELDDVEPGDVDDVVPGDVDDVVPGESGGSLEGEVVGVVTAALDGGLPGDGDDPFPGDPGNHPGGLIPEGSGIDPGGVFDRLVQIIPGAIGGSGPGGNGGGPAGNGAGAPAVNTSTNGSVSGSVAVGGVGGERGGPTDVVLSTEIADGAPALVGTSISPGSTLPRTGGGLGNGVLRLVAVLGLARALVGLVNRRRPAPGARQG